MRARPRRTPACPGVAHTGKLGPTDYGGLDHGSWTDHP
jgi:hypothetical protein